MFLPFLIYLAHEANNLITAKTGTRISWPTKSWTPWRIHHPNLSLLVDQAEEKAADRPYRIKILD